jgi:hypothetical protein
MHRFELSIGARKYTGKYADYPDSPLNGPAAGL